MSYFYQINPPIGFIPYSFPRQPKRRCRLHRDDDHGYRKNKRRIINWLKEQKRIVSPRISPFHYNANILRNYSRSEKLYNRWYK